MTKKEPKMLFNVDLRVFSKLQASMQISEGINAKAVWRMKLRSEELTASIMHFIQLQNASCRQQILSVTTTTTTTTITNSSSNSQWALCTSLWLLWTGRPTKPGRSETKTSFNTSDIQKDKSNRVASYRSFTAFLVSSIFHSITRLLNVNVSFSYIYILQGSVVMLLAVMKYSQITPLQTLQKVWQ